MNARTDYQTPTHDRLARWNLDLAPENAAQLDLVQHAERISNDLNQLARVEADHRAFLARIADFEQTQRGKTDAITLGHELLDPSTDIWLKRNPSWAGVRADKKDADRAPRPPELLVHLLESTPEGCHWLWERWVELDELMGEGLTWGPADERKAIRLLGMTPDAEDNRAIRELRLTVMAFLGNPLQSPIPDDKKVPTREEARVYIQALCARKKMELEERRAMLVGLLADPSDSARHEFDASEAGKVMRRHQATLHRELLKTMELLVKLKRMVASERKAAAAEQPEDQLAATTPTEPPTAETKRTLPARRALANAWKQRSRSGSGRPARSARMISLPARRGHPGARPDREWTSFGTPIS